eukprot:3665929-Pyramimonas_sp.AAC.2
MLAGDVLPEFPSTLHGGALHAGAAGGVLRKAQRRALLQGRLRRRLVAAGGVHRRRLVEVGARVLRPLHPVVFGTSNERLSWRNSRNLSVAQRASNRLTSQLANTPNY